MIFVIGMLFATMVVMGALLAATPWLMPRNECFGVTIPRDKRAEEPIRTYMRSYTRIMCALIAICVFVWIAVFALGVVDVTATDGAAAFSVLIGCTLMGLCVASVVLMLHYRKLVRVHKDAQGWHADARRAAAFVGGDDFPRPLPLAVNLVYLPLLLVMAAFALMRYDDFPARIPMHINFGGEVSDYAPKSMASVLFPVYMTAFLGIVFAITHWGILHSKKPVDPDAPQASALAYARFARAQSIVLGIGGIVLSVVTGVTFFASSLGAWSLQAASMAMVAATIAFVVPMIVVTVRYGQAGSRVAGDIDRDAAGNGTMTVDDDAHWPLGFLYCNAQDSSIFVPKRFGVGWTLNIANPLSWVVLAGIVFAVVALCWATSTMELS